MKYVSDKHKKPFCADLKTVYHAPNEDKAFEALERVTEKWNEKYPNFMKSWKQNWDAISPTPLYWSIKTTILIIRGRISFANLKVEKRDKFADFW